MPVRYSAETKRLRILEAARVVAQADATEQGEEWFKAWPEALMVQAHREAHRRFGPDDPHEQVWAFVYGFSGARARRDEYLHEQQQLKGNQP